jgi:hypothetical protein
MATVKVLGDRGQIAFGEQYAGRHAVIEELNTGGWIVKLEDPIPDNERWIHTPEVQADLEESFAWAVENPARETDLDELEEQILYEPGKRAPGES